MTQKKNLSGSAQTRTQPDLRQPDSAAVILIGGEIKRTISFPINHNKKKMIRKYQTLTKDFSISIESNRHRFGSHSETR